MPREHSYRIETKWIGNDGQGTANYRAYRRDYEVSAAGKAFTIPGSSDPSFRGDGSRYNPEEMLVASLSTCHMLWILHLCADAGIVITDYRDEAVGTMLESADGSGQFTGVVLHPCMTISDAARIADATALHSKAHSLCFIARSVNFPVEHEPVVLAISAAA